MWLTQIMHSFIPPSKLCEITWINTHTRSEAEELNQGAVQSQLTHSTNFKMHAMTLRLGFRPVVQITRLMTPMTVAIAPGIWEPQLWSGGGGVSAMATSEVLVVMRWHIFPPAGMQGLSPTHYYNVKCSGEQKTSFEGESDVLPLYSTVPVLLFLTKTPFDGILWWSQPGTSNVSDFKTKHI